MFRGSQRSVRPSETLDGAVVGLQARHLARTVDLFVVCGELAPEREVRDRPREYLLARLNQSTPAGESGVTPFVLHGSTATSASYSIRFSLKCTSAYSEPHRLTIEGTPKSRPVLWITIIIDTPGHALAQPAKRGFLDRLVSQPLLQMQARP